MHLQLSEQPEHLPDVLAEFGFSNVNPDRFASMPTTLEGLKHHILDEISISASAAGRMGFVSANSKTDNSRQYHLKEFAQFHQETISEKGLLVKIRWGVAIRWMVSAVSLNGDADLSSLPAIAASSQFKYCTAQSQLRICGITHPNLKEIIPEDTGVNVLNYARMSVAFHNVRKLLYDPETKIDPHILSVDVETRGGSQPTHYTESIATHRALTSIKDGLSLKQAIAQSKDEGPPFIASIREVYFDLLKVNEISLPDENAMPTAVHKEMACEILRIKKSKKGWFGGS